MSVQHTIITQSKGVLHGYKAPLPFSILAEQSKEVDPEGGAGSFFHSRAGGWADISVTDDETDKI